MCYNMFLWEMVLLRSSSILKKALLLNQSLAGSDMVLILNLRHGLRSLDNFRNGTLSLLAHELRMQWPRLNLNDVVVLFKLQDSIV